MATLTRDCPHCHTKNSSFRDFGFHYQTGTRRYITAFYCGGCHGGYIAEIAAEPGQSPDHHSGDIRDAAGLTVVYEYPKPEQINVPGHLPEALGRFFIQAAESNRSGNHDASAMMSRKTLEVATKRLAPQVTDNLYSRIELLESRGKITPDLKDWAHIIRDDGNIAAHEEEPVSPEFAAELLSFTEMFLMYTFTMPAMIKSKRHDEGDEDPSESA